MFCRQATEDITEIKMRTGKETESTEKTNTGIGEMKK